MKIERPKPALSEPEPTPSAPALIGKLAVIVVLSAFLIVAVPRLPTPFGSLSAFAGFILAVAIVGWLIARDRART